MAIYDSWTWYGEKDYLWRNHQLQVGQVVVENNQKVLHGTAQTINQIGFIRSFSIFTNTDYIFQIDFKALGGTVNIITLCGIGLEPVLNSTNTVNVMFNTFLSSQEIRLNDYGEDQVAGGSAIADVVIGQMYTAKLGIRVNGVVIAYIDAPTLGLNNHILGTTSIANNLNNDLVYFSAQQTICTPDNRFTGAVFDNYVVHDNGLNFRLPERQDLNLDSGDFLLKEKYG